jgi:hypothetical protein
MINESVACVKGSFPFLAEGFSIFLGWLLGIFSAPLSWLIARKLLGPDLRLHFDNSRSYIVDTKEELQGASANLLSASPTKDVTFYRMRTTNEKKRTATKCQAWLVAAQKIDLETGELVGETRDTMPLIWSYNAANPTVDIPRGIDRYIDLFTNYPGEAGLTIQIRGDDGKVMLPLCYENLFTTLGSYRLTVMLTAEECEPKIMVITVDHPSPDRLQVSES